jgi:putative heme-binding domain-containing protein
MRSLFPQGTCALLALILVGLPLCGQDPYARHIASTPPRQPADEAKLFRLPPGFEAQLVASDPDLYKPLNLAFDHQGRLWVTNTLEYPFPAKENPRDSVRVLEDFGPDGRARKITTFADGLNIPIGVLPLPPGQRGALVFSIPNIYRFRDTTGNGKADQRDLLYGTFGFRDTHGLTSAFTWGFDGWVYACHGYANTSTVRARDGSQITMNSGNTYRIKADGSRIEWFTHGQVNPFGLSFDPLGNLYSADCHSKPIYQLLRGAYYPSFGKPDDGLGFGPQTISTYQGSTAIAGISYYAADQFPEGYQETNKRASVFVGDVVTNQIVHFSLDWNGSSPVARQEVFLESKDPWFRPVDIELGPDGALYVADFYNRIIGHYEVPLDHPGRDRRRGRIWRIVYKGGKTGTPAPRYLDPFQPGEVREKAPTVDELVRDLNHPNLAVRLQAANLLVARGMEFRDETLATLREALDGKASARGPGDASVPAREQRGWQRCHGLWVLERLGALEEARLQAGCKDSARLVRVHALHILAERETLSDAETALVVAALDDPDPNVQRAAADALGQHPAFAHLQPLLALRHRVPAADTHLLHVVRMALRNQLRPASTWDAVEKTTWSDADQQALADVALGVPSEQAARFLMGFLEKGKPTFSDLTRLGHHIARHGARETTGRLFSFMQGQDEPARQLVLLRALHQGFQERGAPLSRETLTWARELAGQLLESRQGGEVQAGIELAGLLKLRDYEEQLSALALSADRPVQHRRAALDSLQAIDLRRHLPLLGRVLKDGGAPEALREHAANLLAQANQPQARALLVEALGVVPARLQTILAQGLASNRPGGEALLDAVGRGKASARLLQDRGVALRLDRTGIPKLKERLEKLTASLPPADASLNALVAKRLEGFRKAKADSQRGLKAFTTHCATCHQIADKGARVGPQLDGIGLRGVERLLEDILDPNRNVDESFRTSVLALKDGRTLTGLVQRQEGEVLILVDGEGKESRVSKKAVEEQYRTLLSPMPSNLVERIPEADFYDLLNQRVSKRE